MRGEYRYSLAAVFITVGSTPHAWGIPRVVVAANLRNGINPTCVGNTTFATYKVAALPGSTPHAWGIRT